MINNNFKIDISLKSEKKKRNNEKIITKRKITDATTCSQNKFVKSKTNICI